MKAFITFLLLLTGSLVLLAIDPGWFLIALLLLIFVTVLDFFVRHSSVLLMLLGLGFLTSLFGGDDCDCDL